MRIHPSNRSSRPSLENKPIGESNSAFSCKIKKSIQAEGKSGSILSHKDLALLASDFKNGIIDRKEASDRFIRSVVDNSVRGRLGEGDYEKLIKDIAEFFSHDQEFQQKLEKNLSEIV